MSDLHPRVDPSSTSSPWRAGAAALILGIIAASAGTGLIYSRALDQNEQRALASAADLRRAIELRTATIAEVLVGLDAYVDGVLPEADAFDRYIGRIDLTRYPSVRAIQLIVSDGASARTVAIVPPIDGAIGFDHLASPDRASAFNQARDNGALSATSPIDLLAPGRRGIVIYHPLYARGAPTRTGPERRRAFIGAAAIAIDVEDLVADAFRGELRPVQILDVGAILADAPTEGLLLAGNAFAEDSVSVDANVADRRWRIASPVTSALPAGLLAGTALGIIAMLAAFIAAESARGRRFRDEARETARLSELNRFASQLLSTVSHEMRTPLAAIRGFVKLLREGQLRPGEREDFYERVDRNASTLDLLIAELVEYQHIQRLGTQLPLHPVRLSDAVRRVTEQLAPIARQHDILQSVDRTLSVVANDGALERVITNLLTNAMKFSPAGSPIDITSRVVGDRVELRIADRGPGIARADREVIFEPFYRGVGAHVDRTAGTGIGLAIVKQLVHGMEGTISVEDNPGGGARLALALRLSRIPAALPADGSADSEEFEDGAA